MNRFTVDPRIISRQFFEQSGETGGGKTESSSEKKEESAEVKFDEAQAKELGRIVAKERKEAADKAKADALQEIEDQKKKDADKAKADADKAKGDFEAVERGLNEQITKLTDERDALKKANATLTDTLKSGVDKAWKELPDEVRKLAEKSHGEDDVAGRYAFLHDDDTAALLKRLGGSEEGDGTKRKEKKDPPRNTGEKPSADQMRREYFAMRGHRSQ